VIGNALNGAIPDCLLSMNTVLKLDNNLYSAEQISVFERTTAP
jgi:hypothetical protein